VVTPTDVKLISDTDPTELCSFLRRFIFPFDKVEVFDETSVTGVLTIIGGLPTPATLEQWLGVPTSTYQEASRAQKVVTLDSHGLLILPGNDLTPSSPSEKPEKRAASDYLEELQGATLLYPKGSPLLPLSDQVEWLRGDGATQKWESLRRVTGRLHVLQDAKPFNASALELGLMHTINFQKGCYAGNEVVSKQVLTKAVRRRLVGLMLADNTEEHLLPPAGSELVDDKDDVVGVVTSPASSPREMSLALVKAKLVDEEESPTLRFAGSPQIRLIPQFLAYPRFDAAQSSRAPPLEKLQSKGKQIIVPSLNPASNKDESAEETRKREKLAAMAAKVAALQEAKKKKQ